MPSPPRVLFVGIDAAEQSLLLQWASQGHLPNLQALLACAAWGQVTNPPGFYVGAVWPTFWTGRQPSHHKRYCHTQLRPGSYESVTTSPKDVQCEAFWDPLSRAGRRVAVLDVPKTRVSPEQNGIHVVDWGTHDPDGPPASAPPGLAQELVAAFGSDPISNCNGTRRNAADFQRLRDQLCERARSKGKLAAHLLERDAWDLFLTVFSESHCAGHQFWHLHDAQHPRHDAQQARALGNPLRDVYASLDAEVGALLSRAGPKTHVFLMTSHGMGPHYDAGFFLGRILQQLQGANPSRTPERAGALAKHVWDRLPGALKAPLRSVRKPVKSRLDGSGRDISGDVYFQVPNNDHFGAVRINLRGREPAGVVAPGEYDAVCSQLIEDLSALVNLDTSNPAVNQAVLTRDLYPGDDVADLPDVLVEWSREAPHERLYSPKTGEVQGTYRGCRTGDHRAEGLFLALGPGIRPGRIEGPVSIADFAPTLAGLLEVELAECDGRDLMPRLRG